MSFQISVDFYIVVHNPNVQLSQTNSPPFDHLFGFGLVSSADDSGNVKSYQEAWPSAISISGYVCCAQAWFSW